MNCITVTGWHILTTIHIPHCTTFTLLHLHPTEEKHREGYTCVKDINQIQQKTTTETNRKNMHIYNISFCPTLPLTIFLLKCWIHVKLLNYTLPSLYYTGSKRYGTELKRTKPTKRSKVRKVRNRDKIVAADISLISSLSGVEFVSKYEAINQWECYEYLHFSYAC
jgi:hypothetical protein